MNMKTTFAAALVATMAASASVADNQDLLESKVDSINAKRGLELGGSIRAVAQSSTFDNDQDKHGINRMHNVEKDEFVTADLVFGFRPYEPVRANVMLRLEAGMQEYFASAAKSISVPWINVEGNIGNSLYWVVGDFRQAYSPLTLFLPGIDVMYEPQIFARKRHMAQKEQLIEGNQRNLQGANIQFRNEFGQTAGEVRAEALFARVNRTAVLDLSGAEGNILPNEGIAGATQASNTDKWLVAGNLEWLPFSKSLYVGATPMYIFDNENTYSYTYRRANTENLKLPYDTVSINPYEVNPQKTLVISGRLGVDAASMAGSSNLIADLTAEFAMSKDDIYNADYTNALANADEDGNINLADIDYTSETLDGIALLVNGNFGYKTDAWGVKLSVDGIYNDSNWFNNLAQSPSFFAQRILNSDKDGETVKYGVNSPLYSSFDALYNFNPKFSPVATTLTILSGTNDDSFVDQPASYNVENYNKNSWTTNVYSRAQLDLLKTLADPALQMALPNGLATSNRIGARGILTANVGDFAEAQGLFAMFKEAKPLSMTGINFKEAEFMEFGGGAKIDIFKLVGFSKPLELSGSYKHSESTLETDIPEYNVKSEVKSDFINAGLYVQYLPRLGINGGFQMINNEYSTGLTGPATMPGAGLAPLTKSKQMQWMVGLDYNIASNTWLAINFGFINVENEYNTVNLVGAIADGEEMETPPANLPNYYDMTQTSGTFTHEFSQMVLEASINVEF
ncbi:MAG: hypothetical protein HUK20_12395 [Fibrobacter sp.]|nr:hypothetical protein [Fibrobacter sp.]